MRIGFLVFPALFLLLVVATPGWALSDPTRPSGFAEPTARTAPAAKPSPLVLQAILYSEIRQVAVVNGRSLQVGDRIGGWRVHAITPAEVVMRSTKGVRHLTLKQRPLKSFPVPAGD